MRFKRGTKVEVVNKKHYSSASWRRAEILSGNGDTHTVRYDYYPGTESRGRIERVSKKDIRACTPCIEGLYNQEEIGRVMEVFDNSSWKTATVVKVLDCDYYLVCETGCMKEFCVHRSNTRVLNIFQDEERDFIGKGSGRSRRPDQHSASKPSTTKGSKVTSFSARNRFLVGDDRLAVQECTELQKSHISSSLLLNRVSHVALSKNETSRNVHGLDATERAIKRRRVGKENITHVKHVHDSLNNVSDRYCALERTKRSTESSDCHSDACSVGSCSINDKSPNFSPEEVCCQGTELLHSDAESFQRHSFSSPEKIAASIHGLEVHAYRSTLEALYASGPLSWDQEALLTNLRIALHISNDEHLAELRTLISAGSGIQVS